MTRRALFPEQGQAALRRFWRLPALQALLIQCLCFLPTLATLYLLARLGAALGYGHVVLIQGVFACLASWWRGLAPWWRGIQLAFPLLVLAAFELALPPELFLAAFLLLVLVFWSTFRTQVPFYPSGRAVRKALASLLAASRAPRVIDIGSGFGDLVLDLARRRPDAQVEGIEIAPLPWLASRLRARLSRSRARFVLGDYERLDFGAYDLVFAYLSPAAMEGLWRKAEREMRPGSRLASYEFRMPARPPRRHA